MELVLTMAGARMPKGSPIAAPPRAALSGRVSRSDALDEGQSSESSSEPNTSDAKAVSRDQVETGIDTDDKAVRVAHLEKEMATMEERNSKELSNWARNSQTRPSSQHTGSRNTQR